MNETRRTNNKDRWEQSEGQNRETMYFHDAFRVLIYFREIISQRVEGSCVGGEMANVRGEHKKTSTFINPNLLLEYAESVNVSVYVFRFDEIFPFSEFPFIFLLLSGFCCWSG